MSDRVAAPASEAALLERARALAGLSLAELAARERRPLPRDLRGHKGIVGELLERCLGAGAAARPVPDFEHLGIELKTIPLGRDERPRESTHVCSVAVDDLAGQCWQRSTVHNKLARVLWVPVEGDPAIPLGRRRIGAPRLWSPSAAQEAILRADWEEHMELIATGRVDQIDARLGTYLQVRPKAANRAARIAAHDSDGCPGTTLPRGFYLRATFTATILAAHEP